jgi:hypothetical protein
MDLSIRFDGEVHIHFDDKKIDELRNRLTGWNNDREFIPSLGINE